MSNETANRSHAGLVLQMYADPKPPRILASWGFDDSSLSRVAGLDGVYTIRLTQPASGLIGPLVTEFENIDSLVLSSSVTAEPVLFARALLLPDPDGPAPVVGARSQLPFLTVSLTDEEPIGVDGDAVIQLEVRAVPQQT